MKTIFSISFVAFLGVFLLISCKKVQAPKIAPLYGWLAYGNNSKNFTIALDSQVKHEGRYAVRIENLEKEEDSSSFTNVMQQFSSVRYNGKRVKLTVYIRAENVESYAAAWMRVESDSQVVAFDNMIDGAADRSIKGSRDWMPYSIVLDIPQNSSKIFFGTFLVGKGKIWIDRYTLEIAGENEALTSQVFSPYKSQVYPRNGTYNFNSEEQDPMERYSNAIPSLSIEARNMGFEER